MRVSAVNVIMVREGTVLVRSQRKRVNIWQKEWPEVDAVQSREKLIDSDYIKQLPRIGTWLHGLWISPRYSEKMMLIIIRDMGEIETKNKFLTDFSQHF